MMNSTSPSLLGVWLDAVERDTWEAQQRADAKRERVHELARNIVGDVNWESSAPDIVVHWADLLSILEAIEMRLMNLEGNGG